MIFGRKSDFFGQMALQNLKNIIFGRKIMIFVENAQSSNKYSSGFAGARNMVGTDLESPECVDSEIFWFRSIWSTSGGAVGRNVGADFRKVEKPPKIDENQ